MEGYKFFLFFLLLIVWPPSVLIFFFWSSFPVSFTKRFLFRSLLIAEIINKRERHGFIWTTRSQKEEERDIFWVQSNFHHFIMFLCWLSRSPSSPMRSRTAEEACCSKAVPSPLRLNLAPHRTWATGYNKQRMHFNHVWCHFSTEISKVYAWPSLGVEVFGSVGDVILLIFAQLSASLDLWLFFPIFPQTSPFSTDHCREHPLVETRKITCQNCHKVGKCKNN